METNDITAEKVEKLYNYLKEENNNKLKNIEYKISAREGFLTGLDDDSKIESVNQEIEGLRKYKEQFEEELSNIEELKSFADELKEIEEEISSKKQEIEEIEKEEKQIDLNDEDAPSNLYDLSERKKELNKTIENLNWQKNWKSAIVLASYEKELSEIPENMRYHSTISSLDVSLENASDTRHFTLQKISYLKDTLLENGIELDGSNLYNLTTLEDDNLKLAKRYNDLVKEINKLDYDISYYDSQLDSLKKLADIEKQIDDLTNDATSKNTQEVEELSNNRKELIEKVKNTQNEYNNRSKKKYEQQEKEQQQEEQENESQRKDSSKNNKNIKYHSASYKLNKRYEEKLQELNENIYDLESQINDIIEEFNLSGFDIEDEYSYQENDELTQLKTEYDRLSQELENNQLDISNIQGSDVIGKIDEVKQIEDKIEEIDNQLEEIDDDIDKYKEIVENQELSDDSDEKKNAQVELKKLQKEKSKKRTEKNEFIDKKDELYKYVNKKINDKSKNKEKSNNNKNTSKEEGYWVFPTSSNEIIENNSINETNTENENKALVITSGNVIEDYSKADNKVKSSLYLSEEFGRLVGDLKSARGFRSISKKQKTLLKDAIENHGNAISKDLEALEPKVFTKIVKDIYGDDTEFLNKYLTKQVLSDDEIINHGIFSDLYDIKDGKVSNIKSINNMNEKSVEFINKLLDKYYEKVQNGEIQENSSLDVQFKKMIANPVKFGIISNYNKDIQKPFLFRLNNIKMLFSKKAKEGNEKIDKINSNIKTNEDKLVKSVKNKDRLGLGNSVEKNPPPIVEAQTKEVPTKDVDSQQL